MANIQTLNVFKIAVKEGRAYWKYFYQFGLLAQGQTVLNSKQKHIISTANEFWFSIIIYYLLLLLLTLKPLQTKYKQNVSIRNNKKKKIKNWRINGAGKRSYIVMKMKRVSETEGANMGGKKQKMTIAHDDIKDLHVMVIDFSLMPFMTRFLRSFSLGKVRE